MAQIGANLSGYKTLDDFEPLPPGEYHVGVVDSGVEQKQNGMQAKFVYEVIGGDHAGRKIYDRMWITHTNATAAEIGLRSLKTLATAAGHQNPNMVNDTEELHGRELIVRLAVREHEGKHYQDVKAYKPVNGQAAPAQTPRPAMPGRAPAGPAAGAAAPRRPWEQPR